MIRKQLSSSSHKIVRDLKAKGIAVTEKAVELTRAIIKVRIFAKKQTLKQPLTNRLKQFKLQKYNEAERSKLLLCEKVLSITAYLKNEIGLTNSQISKAIFVNINNELVFNSVIINNLVLKAFFNFLKSQGVLVKKSPISDSFYFKIEGEVVVRVSDHNLPLNMFRTQEYVDSSYRNFIIDYSELLTFQQMYLNITPS
jgi:hypothetical protein